jgi:hypothetical protein
MSAFDPFLPLAVAHALAPRHPRRMMRFRHASALVLLILPLVSSADAAPAAEFSNSYGLDVGEHQGRCIFFLSDTGMTAAEVTRKLKRDGYDKSRGLEVLVTKTSPRKCAELGQKAARNAGFKAVRVRLAADKDRWQRP